ncbi:FAD:protein FMN transferase [Flavihumibacter sp. CACIAM 22H1]|uniref:FAD:protein FMN transferase n=1 Tax=Flavihumibacter sp. CACIAM 22H1 TaxID=1812911 RepID=UPI000A8DE9B5|nr:FAD:protein FMN transferase [Flavihumibacter sp. CACIAM 22H1]
MIQKLIFSLLLLIAAYYSYAQPKRFEYVENKMASPFTIILYHEDSSTANRLARESFLLVDSLAAIFTDYDENSELNRFCATASNTAMYRPLSPALFDILLRSKRAWQVSKGSFDISLGGLTKLWRMARKTDQWPSPDSVAAALNQTGMKYLQLDPRTQSARLLKPGIQLDLGGIAQGYIGDQVMRFLQSQGITTALIDVSGDITVRGHPPGKSGWVVAINTPHHEEEWLHDHLYLQDHSVTSSGDLYQYMEHEGKRYSHIINPKTGYGLTARKSVTVVAKDPVVADWLTKAISILPLKKARKLAKKLDAEFLIAELEMDELKFHHSKGFANFMKTFASKEEVH